MATVKTCFILEPVPQCCQAYECSEFVSSFIARKKGAHNNGSKKLAGRFILHEYIVRERGNIIKDKENNGVSRAVQDFPSAELR